MLSFFASILLLLFTSAKLPIESDPINAVIISMDDIDLYKDTRFIFNLWITIIKSAQRQNINVIAYLVKQHNNLELIKENLKKLVDIDKINFITDYTTDTIWIRDYGPIFYYDLLNRLSILDLTYFDYRPLDDAMPLHFAKLFNLPYKKSKLRIEGGNLLSNGVGKCILSDKVLNYNSMIEIKKDLIGCNEIIIVKSLKYDKTQHVDMWLFWLNYKTVIMGIYDVYQDKEDHDIMVENYSILKNHDIDILFMPMPSHCSNGSYICSSDDFVSRSYMNVITLNDEIIVPIYNIDTRFESEAILKWIQYSKKRIITVESDVIVKEHGVIHCITKTIPKNLIVI